MVIGYSIRKSAEIVEVGVKTSFYMRHKILDCIGTFMGTGHVDGVVEMDETFVAESFKGNHKKSGWINLTEYQLNFWRIISIGSIGYNVLKMIIKSKNYYLQR